MMFSNHAVIAAVAADLDQVVDLLSPAQVVTFEESLDHQFGRYGRRLSIHEEMRLGRVSFGLRTATLLSVVGFDSTRVQLGKQIDEGLAELLTQGLGSMRAVRDRDKLTIKSEELRYKRSFGLDAHLESARVTGLTDARARQVLTSPHEWPSRVVSLASQRLSAKGAEKAGPLAVLADRNNWFPGLAWRPLA
jgi:hypothetical protein